MKRTRVARLGAGLLAASLVAGACGSDDGGQAATGNTIDSEVKDALSGSATTAATTATTAEVPTSMEEWEALWAEQRAAVVARAEAEGWGKSADGNTVTGPAGFTIDLSACPAGWSDTEGLTDTTIKIGQAIAQSGTFADYGNFARGIQTIFDHYASEGMFTDSEGKDRSVDYVTKDDGYDSARTIPVVDELLDSEKAFAIWTLGSPSTLKVYDKINQRCVPHPLAMTAHPAWGDPVHHPWTTGAPNPAYSTEAVLWGGFIEDRIDSEFGGQVTVASLVMNNDFGKVYDQTFKTYIEESEILRGKVEYVTETIEAQAPTVKDPMTTLASKNPDIFIAMVAATPCTQAIIEAAENGMQQNVKYLFQPQTCSGVSFIGKDKVGGDGAAGEGWWIVSPGFKDFKDANLAEDPFVAWGRGLLEEQGIDPDTTSKLGEGFGPYGWVMAQSLIIAGQLEGGLTRTNLMLALRSFDMTGAHQVPGIRLQMNGNEDGYLNEGSQLLQFDSAGQEWVPKGEVIDLNGRSQNCQFDQAAGICVAY
ncbi:MAG: ABC transporter substrate-binding protein [Acidimicrobiia bacterium]|nr:ABC transporter substrate-binding protein [Acidimicrobiia bacterium]